MVRIMPGQGLRMQSLPPSFTVALAGVVAQHDRIDAEERLAGAARLERDGAGQRRDHEPAGLGLPPRIDDRAALVADVL
jgi:hypothetical protein